MLMTKHLTIEVNNEVVKHRVAFILLVKSQYLEEPIDLEKNYLHQFYICLGHRMDSLLKQKGIYASLPSEGVYG